MIQGLLYSNIRNSTFGSFLHSEGYTIQNRKFKLFTFSNILEKPLGVDKDRRKLIYGKDISFFVSTIENEFQAVIEELVWKKETVFLGENQLQIIDVQIAEYEISTKMKVKTTSPITCYNTVLVGNRKRTIYYQPYETRWQELIKKNLDKKYELITGEEGRKVKFSMKCLEKPKERTVYYKKFLIKAYDGIFQIEGDLKMIEIALNIGVGGKNSQGFGLIVPI